MSVQSCGRWQGLDQTALLAVEALGAQGMGAAERWLCRGKSTA